MPTANDEWVSDIARRSTEREVKRTGRKWTEEEKALHAEKIRQAWANKSPQEREDWVRRRKLGLTDPIKQERNERRWNKYHTGCTHGRGYPAMRRCEKKRDSGCVE